jgi:oxalate decarboxylase/phosphoglucose isomerase-like protein (cupin superfamily)
MAQGVQHAGDTVYVPPGWLHGVVNLETTLAVTENVILKQQAPFVEEDSEE